jgi:hypothetical protein
MAKIVSYRSAEEAGELPRDLSAVLIEGPLFSILLTIEAVPDGPEERPPGVHKESQRRSVSASQPGPNRG